MLSSDRDQFNLVRHELKLVEKEQRTRMKTLEHEVSDLIVALQDPNVNKKLPNDASHAILHESKPVLDTSTSDVESNVDHFTQALDKMILWLESGSSSISSSRINQKVVIVNQVGVKFCV